MRYLFFFFVPFFLYAQNGELLRVIDGDTLLLKDMDGFVICQASFIDTPEAIENDKFQRDKKYCSTTSVKEALEVGKKSKNFAKSTLKNLKNLTYKMTRILPNGNPVCQIALPKGLHVDIAPTFSEVMLTQGYALPYVIYASAEQKKHLLEITDIAKREKRGLWGSNPEFMRCLVSKRFSLRSLRQSD